MRLLTDPSALSASGSPFNVPRPDRVPDGYPWPSGLAVRPGVWAVNLKMVEEAVALNQQVHHGVPNGSYDMTAIMKMRWAVKEAQKNAATPKPPTPVEDWLLRNWRVPAGVKKSADQVACHLQGKILWDTRGMGDPSLKVGPSGSVGGGAP